MPTKRFKIKKQWTNSKVWAFTSMMMVITAIAITGMTGQLWIFVSTVGVAAVGFILSIWNDRAGNVSYSIENRELVLKRNSTEKRISFDNMRDASLLDRMAARDLLRQLMENARLKGADTATLKEMRKQYVRYCTVDIGLSSLTFGIGRHLVDQRPDAKNDLVLIRMSDDQALLLSPVYNQEVVESMNRALQRDMPLGKSA
jgi:hypothetical protein